MNETCSRIWAWNVVQDSLRIWLTSANKWRRNTSHWQIHKLSVLRIWFCQSLEGFKMFQGYHFFRFFSIKDTVYVMLMKHESCSLHFWWYAVSLLCLSVASWGLGCAIRWQPECQALVSRHDLAVEECTPDVFWFVGLLCILWARTLSKCEICQWISYCIIFGTKGSPKTCVLGGDRPWIGSNESLQSMPARLKDLQEFDDWNNYPRQSNLCSPTVVWLCLLYLLGVAI